MSGQDFYLNELDIAITANELTLQGADNTTSFVADAHATLKIPKSAAQVMFGVFHTDAIDVNDNSSQDVKFTMFVKNEASDPATDIDAVNVLKYFNSKNIIPGEAIVESGGTVGMIPFYGSSSSNNANERKVGADFNRYLAKELFGIPSALDIFNNERQSRSYINKQSSSTFASNMLALADYKVNYVGEANGYVRNLNDTNNVVDSTFDGSSLDKEATITKANNYPARKIFRQLLGAVPARFDNMQDLLLPFYKNGNAVTVDNESALTQDFLNAHPDLWFKLPIDAGDSLYFVLTVNPANNQQHVVDPNNSTPISARTYKIKLQVVENGAMETSEEDDDYDWQWTDAGYDNTSDIWYLDPARNVATDPQVTA